MFFNLFLRGKLVQYLIHSSLIMFWTILSILDNVIMLIIMADVEELATLDIVSAISFSGIPI